MKQGHSTLLSVSIIAALAFTPALAQTNMESAGINISEALRVTQTVNDNSMLVLQNSHLHFVDTMVPTNALADSTRMNHLQLVLKRSAARQRALDQLITDQHNPNSARFHHWLTPQQFGDSFGVTDSDIATAKAWLISQGFTVNGVYPNKMQIDFDGTAGLVSHVFHTQENQYRFSDGSLHVANGHDISIPAALISIVNGVAGLNEFHPSALHTPSRVARWNSSKKALTLQPTTEVRSKGLAITEPDPGTQSGITRGLVPNDLVTMYGIRTLRTNNVVGTGITIALIENGRFTASSWNNFASVFNLTRYGGSLAQIQPSGPSTCTQPAPGPNGEDSGALQDAEWSTAIAPGAVIVVASCAAANSNNLFGGIYAAATNLINGETRPDIISVDGSLGEDFTSETDKSAIDLMWAQADVEGISVFVPSGDNGPSQGAGNFVIIGRAGVDANALATSPNVTAVGGTDTADVLDGTTKKYFAPKPSIVGGSALSYVPEIPWNQSCGNGVAAKASGYSGAVAYCNAILLGKVVDAPTYTFLAGGGGSSSINIKPTWQRQVHNSARDQSRDVPDVALFAGSYGYDTLLVTCSQDFPCGPYVSGLLELNSGTSISSAMFAGIQALIDQGLAARGLPVDQGNAAPTLYALAADEYGAASGSAPTSLANCNSDNGAIGTSHCVFHNITRGSTSSQCTELGYMSPPQPTSHCYFYYNDGQVKFGLTTTDANPTAYSPANKAYGAQSGWSFAAGLGSVNATNLLIAWRAFVNAPAAPASPSSASKPAVALTFN